MNIDIENVYRNNEGFEIVFFLLKKLMSVTSLFITFVGTYIHEEDSVEGWCTHAATRDHLKEFK